MITLKQAALWCGGTVLPEYADVPFDGVQFDTRALVPGELFVALQGKRDGHDFIPVAMEKGAAGALGSRQLPGVPMVVAAEPLRALGAIAAGYRNTLTGLRVLGLTGSVGKTTTKEMLAAVMAAAWRTQKTEKNYNNDIGVPKTVLSLRPDTQAAVIEMGMNHFGEISYLTRIARPDVAVITNIGTMHIENLGSREGILKAKLEILEGLGPEGTLVLNGDEPLLRRAETGRKTLFFGIETDCDLRAEDIVPTQTGIRFTARGFGQSWPVELPVAGRHNVYNALAALLAGRCAGTPMEAGVEALGSFANTGDRQRIYRQDGYTVIADCYNAGPESMAAALSVLAQTPAPGRRIAVLGDMLELGDHAPRAHREVGALAAQSADLVLAYGPMSGLTAQGAGDKGHSFDTHGAILAALRAQARPGDVLLFKGSHGMHMEQVLQAFFA